MDGLKVRLVSFWDGTFSGATLVSRRVKQNTPHLFFFLCPAAAHAKFLKVRGATEGNKHLTMVVFDAELAPSSGIAGLSGKPTCERRFCGRNEFLENCSVIQFIIHVFFVLLRAWNCDIRCNNFVVFEQTSIF